MMPCRPFWILAASIMESSSVQSGIYHRPIRNLSSSHLEWNHGPHQAQGGDSAGGPDRLGPIVVDKAVKVKSGRGMIEIRRCRYEPRAYQSDLHRSLKRFSVLVAHRRFGKTVFAVGELVRKAGKCKLAAPRFAYIAPFYRQAKAVAWDYLKRYTANLPGATHHETELRCDLGNGAR